MLGGALRRLHFDERGNFAAMTAVLALPLVLGVGVAADTAAIHRSKTDLQDALDSAAIAIAREGVTVSDERARAIADEMVDSNFGGNYSNLQVTRNGTTFNVDAEAVAETAFGDLLGYGEWKVSARSAADIALVPYEIALVLDTTGSMRGGKLQAMKDAVVGLIDTMSANITMKDHLKFAMVPFSSFVNVGPQWAPKFDEKGKQIDGTGAEWLDLHGQSSVKQSELGVGLSRFQLYANLGQQWRGCVETREANASDLDIGDAKADPKKPETLFVPAFSIDEPDGPEYYNSYIKSGVAVTDASVVARREKFAKYGVSTDASGVPLLGGLIDIGAHLLGVIFGGGGGGGSPVIAIDSSPSKYNGKPKGPGNGCDAQPISALSTDYSGLKAKVEALQANGNTNIMEGVAWGARVLSPEPPFAESAKSKPNTRRIMVVLTDGSNVLGVTGNALGSVYSSFGFAADQRLMAGPITSGSSNKTMNDRTLKACTLAKKQGTEIFTIRLEEPDKKTGMMLKDCASAPDHFFDAPSRSQLDEVFGQIRDKITTVRISS